MFKYMLTGSLALLALMTVPAEAKEDSAKPPNPSEFAQLAFFEGSWHCAGKIWYCASASGCATTGTTRIEQAIGGTWLHVTGDETMAGSPPATFFFALYFGYDPKLKSFVSLGVGGAGVYGTQYSKGWKGDTFVLSPDKYLARDTFVRNGANEFTHTGDWQGKDKRWTKVQEEVCHKDQ
jgi:hypothetical protein